MEKFFLTRFSVSRKPGARGFTLLEILIVIAIIGILVSLGVVSYSAAQRKARNSKRRADLKAMQGAWEQYYADNASSYPSSCSIAATYMPGGLPVDPKNSGSYVYTTTCTASTYCFCGLLESETGNASSTTCTYTAGTNFCVSNLQ